VTVGRLIYPMNIKHVACQFPNCDKSRENRAISAVRMFRAIRLSVRYRVKSAYMREIINNINDIDLAPDLR